MRRATLHAVRKTSATRIDSRCLSAYPHRIPTITASRHCLLRSPIPGGRSATMATSSGTEGILERIESTQKAAQIHRAAIALGSNIGDRIGYIEQALQEMKDRGIRVLSVSKLYQTKAMYYENQDSFINGACYVREPSS